MELLGSRLLPTALARSNFGWDAFGSARRRCVCGYVATHRVAPIGNLNPRNSNADAIIDPADTCECDRRRSKRSATIPEAPPPPAPEFVGKTGVVA
jgi:hypothetical protein